MTHPYDSPMHSVAESPFHHTDSPYHVPSSTESPMHEEPFESPMYGLSASCTSGILHSNKLTERTLLSNNNSVRDSAMADSKTSSQKQKDAAVATGKGVPQNRRKRGRRRDSLVDRSGMGLKGVIKMSEENSDSPSDSEYDTSDMEDNDCCKRRRICVEQMDSITSHYEKFKERSPFLFVQK